MAAFPVRLGSNTGVNKSGTITSGGNAQVLSATVTAGFYVYNPGPDVLWISPVGTAAPDAVGSICVEAKRMYVSPQGYKPSGAVSIYAATTGAVFTAEVW